MSKPFGRSVGALLVVTGVFAATLSGARASDPAEGDLSVTVTGLENSNGRVRAGLFTSDEGFPLGVDDVDTTAHAEITGGSATVEFDGIPHGSYAVVVYHDANDNGQLDRNFVGMPSEGAAVYKPVEARVPPPDFDDCAFTFDVRNRTVSLTINYL